MNTALTRRESLWADEPVMRDGQVLDLLIKALGCSPRINDALVSAMTSSNPGDWLCDAETFTAELLEHIRAMRKAVAS